MSAEVIHSVHNPMVAAAARLQRRRERRATGRSLLEGPHLLAAAAAAEATVETVFSLPDDAAAESLAGQTAARWVPVTPDVLHRLAPTDHPRGPVAVFVIPSVQSLEAVDTIVLWELGDPGNAGTIIRAAAAFGLHVAATAGTVDLWSPKTLRAGAGAHFSCRIGPAAEPVLANLHGAGLQIAASVVTGGEAPDQIGADPLALLVGDEAHGLPADAVAGADRRITIPGTGVVESLNAAAATAVLAYEVYRQRRRATSPPEGGR